MSHSIKYCVYKEGDYFVSQCLNVDVSSFGETIGEAIANLNEAVALYFEDADPIDFQPIGDVLIGESVVHA